MGVPSSLWSAMLYQLGGESPGGVVQERRGAVCAFSDSSSNSSKRLELAAEEMNTAMSFVCYVRWRGEWLSVQSPNGYESTNSGAALCVCPALSISRSDLCLRPDWATHDRFNCYNDKELTVQAQS